MKAFIQFDEVYSELVFQIMKDIRRKQKDIEFFGIAIRRETVRKKIDSVADELSILSYDWWNDVERRVLERSYNPDRLVHYRALLGDRNLRKLVTCCREIGNGLLSGGCYAQTKLRRYVEKTDENRWHYVTGILDYYVDLFERESPAFLFINEITFPWEFAAYMVAEQMGIPCLTLCYARSGGGYFIADNPYQRFPEAGSLYQEILKNPTRWTGPVNRALEEIRSFSDQPVAPEYYVEASRKFKKKTSLFGMVRTLVLDLCKCMAMHLGLFGTRGFLRQENWWNVLWMNLTAFHATRRALRGRGFEKCDQYIGTKYIYYPLHVEPESSTLILSAHMTNQLFFLEQISKNMPAGYKLLVKEHFPMLGRRPKGFCEKIRRLPDVHLISPFEDNFDLVRKAKIVCVLTGTGGWEAIQLGVPAIVVGEAQYLGINEGFIRCQNLFKLDEYIQEALSMPPVPVEKIACFVAATRELQSDITPRAVAYWHFGLDPAEEIPQSGVEMVADQLLEKAGLNVSAET